LHRFHIVQEFNKGIYEYILASDESAGQGEADEDPEDESSDDDHESSNASDVKDVDSASTSIMTGRLISALTRANTAASEDEDIEHRGLEEDDSEQTTRKKWDTAKLPRIASNQIRQRENKMTAIAITTKSTLRNHSRDPDNARGVPVQRIRNSAFREAWNSWMLRVSSISTFQTTSRSYTHRIGRTARAS